MVQAPLPPGSVWLLTTTTPDGGHRSRPVTVFSGLGDAELVVLTTPSARKVAEVTTDPRVTLAGPTDNGWWAGEGTAVVDAAPASVAAILTEAGVTGSIPAVALRITLVEAQRWTVHSADPWDNTVEDLPFPFGLTGSAAD
jgi:hypothetical protein